jgi:Holliday junction resolvase RusA-like endonuclease
MKRYPITPVGKPRQTQRDKWQQRPAVQKYRAFADEVRLRGVKVPEAGARVTFVVPMPTSWTKQARRIMDGQPHRQKPDADNLLKSVLDAIYGDDAGVWDVGVRKVWGQKGEIRVEVT